MQELVYAQISKKRVTPSGLRNGDLHPGENLHKGMRVNEG